MKYFCHLDTSGDIDHTNLQLYSLKKAAEAWNELFNTRSVMGNDDVEYLQEQLAFIVSCLGISLSQLLGQNCPSPDKEKINQPGKLLSNILNKSSLDGTSKRLLNSTFKDFLKYYGAIRHFGRNMDDKNYKILQSLDINKLERFRKMTIQIWDVVIGIYRKDRKNDIDDISSIADIVLFNQFVGPMKSTNEK